MEYDSRLMKTKEFERRTKKLMRLPVKETAKRKENLKKVKLSFLLSCWRLMAMAAFRLIGSSQFVLTSAKTFHLIC